MLTKWSDLLAKHSSDLAVLMCLESGKVKAEAKGEIQYARSFITFYAGMQSNGLVLPRQTDKHLLLATMEVGSRPCAAFFGFRRPLTINRDEQSGCARE